MYRSSIHRNISDPYSVEGEILHTVLANNLLHAVKEIAKERFDGVLEITASDSHGYVSINERYLAELIYHLACLAEGGQAVRLSCLSDSESITVMTNLPFDRFIRSKAANVIPSVARRSGFTAVERDGMLSLLCPLMKSNTFAVYAGDAALIKSDLLALLDEILKSRA